MSIVVAESPLARQHFFQFCRVIALGFYWVPKRLAGFFQFFEPRNYMDRNGFLPTRNGEGLGCEMVRALFTILRKLATGPSDWRTFGVLAAFSRRLLKWRSG